MHIYIVFLRRSFVATYGSCRYHGILNPLVPMPCKPLIPMAWSVGFPLDPSGAIAFVGARFPLVNSLVKISQGIGDVRVASACPLQLRSY
jgi:hypothetical protein